MIEVERLQILVIFLITIALLSGCRNAHVSPHDKSTAQTEDITGIQVMQEDVAWESNQHIEPCEGNTSTLMESASVTQLTNEDVTWKGTWVGLKPVLSQRAENVLETGTNAVPDLLQAIQDNNQYAVAHVLLTKILFARFSFSEAHWNQLPVQIPSYGTPFYGPNAHAIVREYWESGEGLKSVPR